MIVPDFMKLVQQSFKLNPNKIYKFYSRVFVSVGVSVFVDISYSDTIGDLFVKDHNGLNNILQFCTVEIVGDDIPPQSDGNVTTNGSHCSFRDSNVPLVPNQLSHIHHLYLERLS
ncbi:hypothetical protein MKX01_010120, partial [Papaver californicum]